MTITTILLILITGIVAGFTNAVGGGGSYLTLPMLIFLGLPSALANGTNRVAVTVQNVSAVINFRRKGYFDAKLSLLLGIPAMIGSILGAQLALNIPDYLFNKILAGVMLASLFLILRKKPQQKAETEEELSKNQKYLLIVSFFFIGFYGGFLQAGVGFVVIALLAHITDMSLVRINSLKVFVILFSMLVSLVIFVWNGKVDWTLGLILAAGNAIGAWLGSSFAVAKGDIWIQRFIVVVITLMSAKLLGVFTYLGHLF